MVGGPAYNDSEAAVSVLKELNLPYVAAHPLEFQTLPQWSGSSGGLGPIETTMLVALPELDGAIIQQYLLVVTVIAVSNEQWLPAMSE